MSDAQVVKRLSAKVEQLTAELAAEREVSDKLNTFNIRLQDEQRKLREAIEPFAKECDRLVAQYHRPEHVMRPTITAGELRRARAALKKNAL